VRPLQDHEPDPLSKKLGAASTAGGHGLQFTKTKEWEENSPEYHLKTEAEGKNRREGRKQQ